MTSSSLTLLMCSNVYIWRIVELSIAFQPRDLGAIVALYAALAMQHLSCDKVALSHLQFSFVRQLYKCTKPQGLQED